MSGLILERAATRLNADPLPLCFGVQVVVTGMFTLVVYALAERGRRILTVLLGAISAAFSSLCFSAMINIARRPRSSQSGLRYNPKDSLWSLVRDIDHNAYTSAVIATCVFFLLYAITLVFLIPTFLVVYRRRWRREPFTADEGELVSKCVFNRVWLNVILSVILVFSMLAFSVVIVSLPVALPAGTTATKKQARLAADTHTHENIVELQECVCAHPQARCNHTHSPSRISCIVALKAPVKSDAIFACITNTQNAPDKAIKVILRDKCTLGTEAIPITMRFTAVIIACMALAYVFFLAMFCARASFTHTLCFITMSYIVLIPLLAAAAPYVIDLWGGPVRHVYGVANTQLVLAISVSPFVVQLPRIVISALFAMLAIMFFAAATEFTGYTSRLTVYSLLGVQPSMEPYDIEGEPEDDFDDEAEPPKRKRLRWIF